MLRMSGLWAATAILAAALTGCGGGGGGSSSLTPTAAIQQRNAAQIQAVINENADALMEYYSDAYTGPNGETKADVRAIWEQAFAQVDFLSHQTIGETFTLAPSGETAIQDGSYQFVAKNRETGEQGLFAAQGLTNWVKEGSDWRILTEDSGSLVRIQNAVRKH